MIKATENGRVLWNVENGRYGNRVGAPESTEHGNEPWASIKRWECLKYLSNQLQAVSSFRHLLNNSPFSDCNRDWENMTSSTH
jgi:hypothetical protein